MVVSFAQWKSSRTEYFETDEIVPIVCLTANLGSRSVCILHSSRFKSRCRFRRWCGCVAVRIRILRRTERHATRIWFGVAVYEQRNARPYVCSYIVGYYTIRLLLPVIVRRGLIRFETIRGGYIKGQSTCGRTSAPLKIRLERETFKRKRRKIYWQ